GGARGVGGAGAVAGGGQWGVPVAGGDALVSVVEEDVRGNVGRDCGGFGSHVSVFRVCGWVGRQSRPGGGAGLAAPDAAEPGGGSTRPSSVVGQSAPAAVTMRSWASLKSFVSRPIHGTVLCIAVRMSTALNPSAAYWAAAVSMSASV